MPHFLLDKHGRRGVQYIKHRFKYETKGPMSKNTVNSLVRGLKILESFTSGSPRQSLAEISNITNTPKATAFRLLKTLAELNYLKYDARYREYQIGPKVLSLGYSMLQSLEIPEIVRPYLEGLSRECEKTVNFAILDETEMVYIERIRAPDIRDFNIAIGSRIPIYCTSVGRVVMAYMEERKLNELLMKVKSDPKSIPFVEDRRKLLQTLRGVRQKGFATADEEYLEGVGAVAVPVFNSEEIIGGINLVVSRPTVTMDELVRKYAPKLIRTGREISHALGFPPENVRTSSLRVASERR